MVELVPQVRFTGRPLVPRAHRRPRPSEPGHQHSRRQAAERTGPDHAPQFTISVRIEGFDPLSQSGPSKRVAEHKAAEAFLQREKVWKVDT